jgi:hypothetical protein
MDVGACAAWYIPSSPREADDLSRAHDISRPNAEHVQMRALGEYSVSMVNHNLVAKISRGDKN